MGKPGSDILDGNFRFAGNWKECREVKAVDNDTNMITYPYTGKYCTGYVLIDAVCYILCLVSNPENTFSLLRS